MVLSLCSRYFDGDIRNASFTEQSENGRRTGQAAKSMLTVLRKNKNSWSSWLSSRTKAQVQTLLCGSQVWLQHDEEWLKNIENYRNLEGTCCPESSEFSPQWSNIRAVPFASTGSANRTRGRNSKIQNSHLVCEFRLQSKTKVTSPGKRKL